MFFTFYDITTLNSTYQAKLKAPGVRLRCFWKIFGGLEGEVLRCDDCHKVTTHSLWPICLLSVYIVYLVALFISCILGCIPLCFFFWLEKNSQEKCENFKKSAVFFPSLQPPAGGGRGCGVPVVFRQWMSRNSRWGPPEKKKRMVWKMTIFFPFDGICLSWRAIKKIYIYIYIYTLEVVATIKKMVVPFGRW